MHSSDDGISLPLAMVRNLCIDKKLGFDSPRCAVSFPRIGIGQMDSKQEFFAPSDVQVNLQCAMLISSAAYTHSMTKVAVQLFVRRFGPGVCGQANSWHTHDLNLANKANHTSVCTTTTPHFEHCVVSATRLPMRFQPVWFTSSCSDSLLHAALTV